MKTSIEAMVLVWTQVLRAQHEVGAGTSMASSTAIATTTTAKTSSASSSVQTINVGESGLEFSPDTLNVAAGNKVECHFLSGGRSVTQAFFDNLCHPLSDSSFSNGFVTGSSNGSPPVFTLIVNNTKSICFYCGQVGNCQAGMVGVINSDNGANTLSVFNTAAGSTTGSSVPTNIQGGILGKESDQSSAPLSPSASTSTSTGGSSPSGGSSSPNGTNTADNLSYSKGVSVAGILALMTAGFFI
ncbi:hypothetical protein N7523_001502 [Penicillium sp. IBT 18751x]|nr:hypothetical protein N7523_001502 [Penicillium sp. IBT 18751x]